LVLIDRRAAGLSGKSDNAKAGCSMQAAEAEPRPDLQNKYYGSMTLI